MGISYFNLHVGLTMADISEMKSAVASAVRGFYSEEAYEEITLPHSEQLSEVDIQNIDSMVVLTSDAPHHWISVYLNDDYDAEKFAQISFDLSQATQSDVVTFWLDDHALLMQRYTKGSLIDSFSTDITRFYVPGEPNQSAFLGHAELWADLLLPPALPAHIEAFWRRDYGYASRLSEQLVGPLAELFGINSMLAQTNCEDFNIWSPEDDEDLADAMILAFRSCLPQLSPTAGIGMPCFIPSYTQAWIDVIINETLADIGMSFFNTGGAAQGIYIEFAGDAITKQLIGLARVDIKVNGKEPQYAHVNGNLWQSEQQTVLVHVATLPIPVGVDDPYFWRPVRDTTGSIQAQLYAAEVSLLIQGVAKRIGEGELKVRMFHILAEQADAEYWAIPVTVRTP